MIAIGSKKSITFIIPKNYGLFSIIIFTTNFVVLIFLFKKKFHKWK
jgi:hypothetical protein